MSKKHSGPEAIPVSPSLDTDFIEELPSSSPVNIRVLYLSLQAVLNAIVIGVIARALVALIDLITNISFYGRWSFAPAEPGGHHLGWMVIIVPIIGGLIVGVMARFGSAAIRGHGIPEAMEQVLLNESRIKPVITFLKPISAAISIGTGGPFGAEGPIIATGGAFGSVTGQVMRIAANERKIMLAAGACAGMAAIFGCPLAAVLLAIELLLFEFSPRSIIPVALSCATGAAMHLLVFGTGPVFAMPTIPEPSTIAMLTYVVMGVLMGIFASLVTKSVYAVEDLFEKLPVHWMWWPAIGAVVVGVVGYFAPSTLGVGYRNIDVLLQGNAPLQVLMVLCFLKFISWVFSLGSGTSGGTLAPLLTIGGALGGLLGFLILQAFPGSGINMATAVLIGMAAMFAGASRALLTSIVFALETTMQPHGLLPLIAACTAAYCISFFLMKGSIMTEKIERRGVFAPDSFSPDILQRITASQVMHENAGAPEGNTIGKGPFIFPESRLSLAVDIMDKHQVDKLPVIAHGEGAKVIGYLSHKDIFKAYRLRRREDEHQRSVISLKRRGIKMMVRGRQLIR